jgi:outer membrane murein-binding lipoprotein Lpp
MDCLYETIASAWVTGVRAVNRRAVEGDVESEAREELHGSIEHLSGERRRLEERIAALAAEVRAGRATMARAELRKRLVRSRGLRVQLGTLEKKIATLEQNMDKIEEGQTNRLMLASLKTANKALKRMGNQAALGDTDQVISDLEENLQLSSDVTHTLASGLGADAAFDEDELDAELAELLAEEAPRPIFAERRAPAAPNAMAATTVPEPALPAIREELEAVAA